MQIEDIRESENLFLLHSRILEIVNIFFASLIFLVESNFRAVFIVQIAQFISIVGLKIFPG